MKCPKCDYLGFETGDRCKNCGYDFSLMSPTQPSHPFRTCAIDLRLRAADDRRRRFGLPPTLPIDRRAPSPQRHSVHAASVATAESRGAAALQARRDDDDEPLIKLPAAPRPPLAVRARRRTRRGCARCRGRAPPRRTTRRWSSRRRPIDRRPCSQRDRRCRRCAGRRPTAVHGATTAGRAAPARGLRAAVIDHADPAGDRRGGRSTSRCGSRGCRSAEWRACRSCRCWRSWCCSKLAYFCAFTAVGGQTIGKMALGIRVVTDDDEPVDAGSARCSRTLAAAVSSLRRSGSASSAGAVRRRSPRAARPRRRTPRVVRACRSA